MESAQSIRRRLTGLQGELDRASSTGRARQGELDRSRREVDPDRVGVEERVGARVTSLGLEVGAGSGKPANRLHLGNATDIIRDRRSSELPCMFWISNAHGRPPESSFFESVIRLNVTAASTICACRRVSLKLPGWQNEEDCYGTVPRLVVDRGGCPGIDFAVRTQPPARCPWKRKTILAALPGTNRPSLHDLKELKSRYQETRERQLPSASGRPVWFDVMTP